MDIASRALDIKRSRLLRDCDYIFYAEDKADVAFWSHIFKTFAPGKTFYIRYYTRSDDGVLEHTGKSMALRYLPYLDRNFMLCLDSDYDYIVSTPNFDIGHYIFQTYTYSIENYKCYGPSLSELCKAAAITTDELDFDIETFLIRYSEIIYPLFIYSIANKIRNFGFHISDFAEVIKFDHRFTDEDVEDELTSLQLRVNTQMAQLQMLCTQAEYNAAETIIHGKGITTVNTYLFIRGHSLYDDIVLRLVKSIVDNSQRAKINDLKDKGRSREIESYLDSCPSIVKLLDKNNNFLGCQVIEKIEADILAAGL